MHIGIAFCLIFSLTIASKLWLSDQWDSPVYEIMLTTNSESLYHFEADFPITSMTADLDLPDGLILKSTGEVIGTPLIPVNRTLYTFSANEGTATAHIGITVIECESGVASIISINPTSILNIALNGELVFSGSVTQSMILCLEKGTYEYNTTIKSFLNMRVSTPHQMVLQRNFYSPDSGTFTIGSVSSSPELSLPSFIPLALTDSSLPIFIEGSFSKLAIEPDNYVKYDFVKGVLTFNFEEAGFYDYKITVENAAGSVSKEFRVGVDSCPENTDRITITCLNSAKIDFDVFDEDGAMIKHDMKHFFCAKHNTKYPFDINYYNEKTDYMFFFRDSLGSLVEYPLNPGVSSVFALNDVISYESAWRFSKKEESKWMDRSYRDTNWTEGKEGQWGEFDASKSIFFRKSFKLDLENTSDSFLHVTLETDAIATIYINGALISEMDRSNGTLHRFTIPFADLSAENVLAIKLQQADSKTILFDVNAFSVESPSQTISIGGSVIEDQPVIDPQYPGWHAFDDDLYSYWKVTGYPASVEYIFEGNRSQIVNSVFFSTVSDRIRTLRIEGVQKDRSSVLLYSLSSNTTEEADTLFFDNTIPYPSYRITIEDSLKNASLLITHIRLQQINPVLCPAQKGVSRPLVDSFFYTQCPSRQVGKAKFTCVQQGKKGVWEEDDSGCVVRTPPSGMVFVDMTLMIRSKFIIDMEFVEKIPSVFFMFLRIKYPEYNTIYYADVSNEKEYAMEVGIRLSMDESLGKYIYRSLMEQKDAIEDRLTRIIDWTIRFEEDPILREPFDWMRCFIISCICILLLVMVIVSMVCIHRGKVIKKLRSSQYEKLV